MICDCLSLTVTEKYLHINTELNQTKTSYFQKTISKGNLKSKRAEVGRNWKEMIGWLTFPFLVEGVMLVSCGLLGYRQSSSSNLFLFSRSSWVFLVWLATACPLSGSARRGSRGTSTSWCSPSLSMTSSTSSYHLSSSACLAYTQGTIWHFLNIL